MAYQIRVIILRDIEGEGQLSQDGKNQRGKEELQSSRADVMAIAEEIGYCQKQQQADDIFAASFKLSQAASFHKAVRKDLLEKNCPAKGGKEKGIDDNDGRDSQCFAKKKRSKEQGAAFKIPGADP